MSGSHTYHSSCFAPGHTIPRLAALLVLITSLSLSSLPARAQTVTIPTSTAAPTSQTATDPATTSQTTTSQTTSSQAGKNQITDSQTAQAIDAPSRPDLDIYSSQSAARQERRDTPRRRTSDPYAPLGIRRGGFYFTPTIESDILYNNNVFASRTNKKADTFLELRPRLDFRSNWSRHEVRGSLSGTRSYARRYHSEETRDFSATLNTRLDVRRRTRLLGELGYDLTQESRNTPDSSQGTLTRPNIITSQAALGIEHSFNRVTLGLTGQVEQQDYESAIASNGQSINNDDRDYTDKQGRLYLTYQRTADLLLRASLTHDQRRYHLRVDNDGFARSSRNWAALAGVNYSLVAGTNFAIALGYAHRRFEDVRLKDLRGLIYEASANWRLSALTKLALQAQGQFEETSVAGSSGIYSQTLSFTITHALRRYMIVTAGLSYSQSDYQDINLSDRTRSLFITGEYIFNRTLALIARLEQQDQRASDPRFDYTQYTARIGLRVRR